MNGDSSDRIFLCGLESPQQLISLNQSVALCEWKG